nr:MAG TPA: hypothetical protein [Caudoviricetes sp.]
MVRERGLSFPEIVSLVRVQPPAPNPKADSVQGQYCGKPILGERCVPSAGRGSAKGRSICPR